ncbi:DnaA inactivator Hda [Utexia brackfieldae]|uniref:DnaA inactivator Hda n=1 Tax=Utexia brackfieldae TaxID=3074108 RepID=UPI00370D7607
MSYKYLSDKNNEAILNYSRQLPLPVSLPDDETFASFYTGKNQLLVEALNIALSGEGFQLIYFWSNPFAGKTHLLHASCSELANQSKTVCYIPLEQYESFSHEVLDGLEYYDLVCLDNIDAIEGNQLWEEAIFDLFNRLYEKQQTCLLITSHSAPMQIGFSLADLVSRLAWGQVYQVIELSDEDKLLALQLRARLRGFEMSDEVAIFLLKRLNRDMRSLCMALEKLDIATITEKRKLTIPFVKEVLSL